MRVILTTILLFLCFPAIALAQDAYSESAAYKPRETPPKTGKKKDKKAKKNKDGRNLQNAAPLEPPPTIKEDVPNVARRLAVTVFDAEGRAVSNLEKTDFKIFVDDREQEISVLGTSREPLNIVLMIDVSPSTAYEIEAIQNYANALVAQLDPQDKVLVIGFAGGVVALTDLTNDRKVIGNAVKKLKFGDGTALWEAVKFSLQERINRVKGRKMVVLLTDGVDTTSAISSEDSLLEAEKSDAVFYPVYIDTRKGLNKSAKVRSGDSTINAILQNIQLNMPRSSAADLEEDYKKGENYLADLAALSGGQVVVTDISKTKRTGFENIFEAFRKQFYLSFVGSQKEISGQRQQVRVRVNRPNLTVLARGSYLVGER